MSRSMTNSSHHSRKTSLTENNESYIRGFLSKAHNFQKEATRILSTHESSSSRTITLEDSYQKLRKLSVKQHSLFSESLECIKSELYRAAHVLAWAAFMDFIEEKLTEDGFYSLSIHRPKWQIKTIEDLRDIGPDYQIIQTLRLVKLCSKTEEKALQGLLSHRNECAHPSNYDPRVNETLGFISEIFQRIKHLQQKSLIKHRTI